jgi:hypothetical protein
LHAPPKKVLEACTELLRTRTHWVSNEGFSELRCTRGRSEWHWYYKVTLLEVGQAQQKLFGQLNPPTGFNR